MSSSNDIRSLRKGAIPAIIVPVTQKQPEEALSFIKEVCDRPGVDFMELRIDCLENALDTAIVSNFVKEAVDTLGDTGSILTFRTGAEGGNTDIDVEHYTQLYHDILQVARPTYIDVEINRGTHIVESVLEDARAHGVGVIVSSHDFIKTDSREALLEQMESIKSIGADVVKVATMPQEVEDLLSLLGASASFKHKYPDQPLITMSMNRLGVLSRLTGELFGSDATFGMIGESSAPGQIDATELREILVKCHDLFGE